VSSRALLLQEIREGRTYLESLPETVNIEFTGKCHVDPPCTYCVGKNAAGYVAPGHISEELLLDRAPVFRTLALDLLNHGLGRLKGALLRSQQNEIHHGYAIQSQASTRFSLLHQTYMVPIRSQQPFVLKVHQVSCSTLSLPCVQVCRFS
jgi:hypothetical protein